MLPVRQKSSSWLSKGNAAVFNASTTQPLSRERTTLTLALTRALQHFNTNTSTTQGALPQSRDVCNLALLFGASYSR
eukprot:2190820-Amphidinium_carterae.2